MLDHEYTVLGGISRVKVGRYLSLISAAVSAGIVFVLLHAVDLAQRYGVPATLPPSVLSLCGAGAVFLALYWVLDRYAWQWKFISKLLKVANLAGSWRCDGQSLDPDGNVRFVWSGTLTITQSWDRIRVRLKTDTSASTSNSAALLHDPIDGFRLFYSYTNEPKIGAVDLGGHKGFAEVTFDPTLHSAKGEYFNGYGRYTFGKLNLKRL